MKQFDDVNKIWPKMFQTVGNMIAATVIVRAGCRKCETVLEVRKSDLEAIAAIKGEDYCLINRVGKCKIVGCDGHALFLASPREGTPMRPLKDDLMYVYNDGITLKADRQGHYFIHPKLNGQKICMMIDTGATDTVLTREDARKLNVDLDRLPFSGTAKAVGGNVRVRPAKLHSLKIGEAVFLDQEVWVCEGELPHSLLGANMIKQFQSVSVKGGLMKIEF